MNEGVQNIDHKKKYDKIQILVDAVIGDVDDIAIMGERQANLDKHLDGSILESPFDPNDSQKVGLINNQSTRFG